MATPRAVEAGNGTTGGARNIREGFMEEATLTLKGEWVFAR